MPTVGECRHASPAWRSVSDRLGVVMGFRISTVIDGARYLGRRTGVNPESGKAWFLVQLYHDGETIEVSVPEEFRSEFSLIPELASVSVGVRAVAFVRDGRDRSYIVATSLPEWAPAAS